MFKRMRFNTPVTFILSGERTRLVEKQRDNHRAYSCSIMWTLSGVHCRQWKNSLVYIPRVQEVLIGSRLSPNVHAGQGLSHLNLNTSTTCKGANYRQDLALKMLSHVRREKGVIVLRTSSGRCSSSRSGRLIERRAVRGLSSLRSAVR